MLRLTAGALALFAYAIGISLAYRLVPVGMGALLLFTAVQLTLVVAGRLTGERPRALSRTGVVARTWPGQAQPDPVGAVRMVRAGAAWGVYSRRERGVGHAVARNAARFCRAVPLAASAIGASLGPIRIDPLGAWLARTSGAGASGMGSAPWYRILRRLPGSRAALERPVSR